MSKEPLKLVTKTLEANQSVVEALEWMLAEARKGNLTQVAIAATDVESCVVTNWSAGQNYSLLIGGIERVKYRLLAVQDEAPRPDDSAG